MISVSIEEYGLIISAPEHFQKNLLDGLNKEIVLVGQFLMAELMKATPVGATGELRRAWKMDVDYVEAPAGKTALVTIYNPQEYLEPTEKGRIAAPISIEGQKSLLLWVQRKLGLQGAKAKSVAFLIGRKKRLTATPGQFFVKLTVERCFPVVVMRLAQKYDGTIEQANYP
jgi:hypothetical protein